MRSSLTIRNALIAAAAGLVLALLASCSEDRCIRHSDCAGDLICGSGGVCTAAPDDAGTFDAGTFDGGSDSGVADAGVDGGASDASIDAAMDAGVDASVDASIDASP